MDFLLQAFVIATIAFIIAEMGIFRPLKERIKVQFLNKLLNCCYCLSFWLTGAWLAVGPSPVFFSISFIATSCTVLQYFYLFFLMGGLAGLMAMLLKFVCLIAKL